MIRSVRHKGSPWKPGLFASLPLRLGKDLVNGEILGRIGEEGLVGSAGEESMQLAGIDFAGYQDVLLRRNAVLLIILDQVITVEGKAVFHVAPYLVDGDSFLWTGNLADDGSKRPGRISSVQQADVFLG